MIKTKRIYEKPTIDDGYRVLVDRLWPRGISNDQARLDQWLKEIAPSAELRKWFGHDPKKWNEFREKYLLELHYHQDLAKQILEKLSKGNVTLLYGAADKEHNHALVLSDYLKSLQ